MTYALIAITLAFLLLLTHDLRRLMRRTRGGLIDLTGMRREER